MIHLKPTKQIKTKYNTIDYNILQTLCNTLFDSICNNKRNYTINIILVEANECLYFNNNRGRITFKMSNNLKNDVAFIKYFLHEFRHFLQDKAFHIKFDSTTYTDSTYEEYINSPLEKDVKLFLDEHLTHFCKIYGKLKKYKELIQMNPQINNFTGFNSQSV